MEKINLKVELKLTLEEAVEMNKLIGKSIPIKMNKNASGTPFCPECGALIAVVDSYCRWCGQRVECEEKDYIPFEEMGDE